MKDSFKEERITKNYIEDKKKKKNLKKKKKKKFDRQFCHIMFCVMTY